MGQYLTLVMETPLKIAVDFDGTIVEHRYPDIDKEILFYAGSTILGGETTIGHHTVEVGGHLDYR